MDYEKKYKEALAIAKDCLKDGTINSTAIDYISTIFPELGESEDEKIRKEILEFVDINTFSIDERHDRWISWLEKQGANVDINPSEFEMRLNRLLKQFESLPKEDIVSSLSFYLNVIQNDGTYKAEEKQGEQKPADKVEPKFKVGDILEYVGERKELIDGKYEIKEIGNGFYVATSGTIIPFKFEKYYINKTEPKFKVEEGKWYICTQTFVLRGKIVVIKGQVYQALENSAIKGEEGCLFVDKHDGKASEYFRLWSIQDAKDGDVLTNGEIILIFKQFEEPAYREHIVAYVGLDISGNIQVTDGYWQLGIDKAIPATKEQRDTLFAKMKEAGYEWDNEKKELKIVDWSKHIKYEPNSSSIVEPKQEWSEGDEKMYRMCIDAVEYYHTPEDESAIREWLKSLKNRVQPQPKEWSEEDEKMTNDLIAGYTSSEKVYHLVHTSKEIAD